jgi:hypothetical protein
MRTLPHRNPMEARRVTDPIPLSPYLRTGALVRSLLAGGIDPETLAAIFLHHGTAPRAMADRSATKRNAARPTDGAA